MIHYIYGDQLAHAHRLNRTMFKDRADQFARRLGWGVSVDANGEERDEYDSLNPLYVAVTNDDGSHAGSMRFLPTVGRTMVNEHFLSVTDGVQIRSPLIWECTRFCTTVNSPRSTAAVLLAAAGKLMQEFALKHFVGVFDPRMERVYRLLGSTPTILGYSSCYDEPVGVGLWEFDEQIYQRMLRRAGLSAIEMELEFANSFACNQATLNMKSTEHFESPERGGCDFIKFEPSKQQDSWSTTSASPKKRIA